MTIAVSHLFTLEWPRNALSPNARQHWAALASARKDYKEMAFVIAHQIKQVEPRGTFPLRGVVTMDVAFFTPGRYHYDEDNLKARLKSGIDGLVAAGILVDDNADALKWGHFSLQKSADPRVVLTLTVLR